MNATRTGSVIAIIGGMCLLAACSRAHEPGEGGSADGAGVDSSSADGSSVDSAATDGDAPPPDAAEVDCPTTCLATCGRGELECRCSVGGGGARCAGYVVHCPSGIFPPECTGTGGIACASSDPTGDEPATCVRGTAPVDPDCVPVCSWEGEFRCVDWRRGRPCEGHVVECPTAEEPPVCVDYGVRCVLPDGELERPVCVPG